MGFEDYTLVGMRLFCPNADEVFVNSATFPSGPDLMELKIPREAMERIGMINLQKLDSTESEVVIQSSKRPRLEIQSTMQSATLELILSSSLVQNQEKVLYRQ